VFQRVFVDILCDQLDIFWIIFGLNDVLLAFGLVVSQFVACQAGCALGLGDACDAKGY
jgi:hypothetical protein